MLSNRLVVGLWVWERVGFWVVGLAWYGCWRCRLFGVEFVPFLGHGGLGVDEVGEWSCSVASVVGALGVVWVHLSVALVGIAGVVG